MVLDDTNIRAQLHSDILSVWGVKKVYDDRPQLPNGVAALPYAYIQLQSQLVPERNAGGTSRTSTIAEVSIPFTYTIGYVDAWPAPGTTIAASKVAKVQALLNVLTASNRYVGHIRDVVGINLLAPAVDDNEPVYQFTVDFMVEVTTGA